MEMLLEQDADLSKRDKDGCTALHREVEGGHREITECLLKANASSLDQDNNGKLPPTPGFNSRRLLYCRTFDDELTSMLDDRR